MRLLLAILIAAALPSAALAQALGAWNYTLHVPVKVTNVPPGSYVFVSCSLYNGANHGGGQDGDGNSPSSNPQVGRHGYYSGTVTVRLTGPTKPGSYACWLSLALRGSSIGVFGGGYNTSNAPGWTGTPVVTVNL
jgi:hypothetical protein